MGIFDRFSLPGSFDKKKTYTLNQPKYSPIIGQASTYKTLATFELDVDAPKYAGDIPKAIITSYEDFK